MKLTLLIFLGIIAHPQFCISQKEPSPFGDVSRQELEMKYCAIDSSADAAILFDKGEIQQFNDGTSNFKVHTRIKFFSKAAYEHWGTVNMLALKSSVSKLKCVTYNLENGVIKQRELTSENILKKKMSKYVEKITFTFPNLTEGAVVEYTYLMKVENWRLPSWVFQASIPVLWSEYSINSFSFKYNVDIRGSLAVNRKYSSNEGTVHRWVMTDVPAFKTEPLMPDAGIYMASIRFWRRGVTWDDVAMALNEEPNFGGILSHPRGLRELAQQITEMSKDPYQKMKAISEYLKKTITWDGSTDYTADSPKDVLERKTGSSGDINLIFGSLLKQSGLHAEMVLISTRDNGLVDEKFPSSGHFNDVICLVRINDNIILLDATEKNLPHDVLPSRCLNYDGLAVGPNGAEWIKVRPNAKLKESVNAALTLTGSGSITGSVAISEEGYSAFSAREIHGAKGKEEFLKEFGKDKTWQITNREVINMDSLEKPVRSKYEVELNDDVLVNGDLVYFNPIVYSRASSNPFVQEQRKYPIDFELPSEKSYVATIEVSPDFELEEIPPNKVIKLPNNDGSCVFSYSRVGSRLFVSYTLRFNKSLFFVDEYPALKQFYGLLVAKMAEQIVLKKKK